MSFEIKVEEEILINAIEMQLSPVGPNKHLKMLALADRLRSSNIDVTPDELWSYFSSNYDLKILEAMAQTPDISLTEETDDNMVESGQEDQLPLRSSARKRTPSSSKSSTPRKKSSTKR